MAKLYVFPGQGSQFVGMGETLFESYPDITATADRVLGYSIARLCLEDPEHRLNLTQFTQPALYTVSVLHYLDAIKDKSATPDCVAGHSLGEYAALFAAGAFDFETGLKLVKKRGELMATAPAGAMAAVIGLSPEQISQALAVAKLDKVQLANINTAEQIVISGDKQQVFVADAAIESAGGEYRPLRVSAGFHSQLMQDIAQQFKGELEQYQLSALSIPALSNVTARYYPQTDYRDLLVKQIDHSVRWHESISFALTEGHSDIEEIGPGLVLTKMAISIKKMPAKVDIEPKQAVKTTPPSQVVALFAGQGTQYKNMGRELYASNPLFRDLLNECDVKVQRECGFSILACLYHPHGADTVDDIRQSHPTLFCFQYALAKSLQAEGVSFQQIVGHSLGEFVAAVIAGAITFDDALALLNSHAKALYKEAHNGRMMVVLDDPSLVKREQTLFKQVYVAGRNFSKSFVVSGHAGDVEALANALTLKQINTQILPVKVAFHSPLLDKTKAKFLDKAERITFGKLTTPVYSSSTQSALTEITAQHLWDAVSQPTDFEQTLAHTADDSNLFVDLSPSGSLCSFIRHGKFSDAAFTDVINQFGHNNQSYAAALDQLSKVKHAEAEKVA